MACRESAAFLERKPASSARCVRFSSSAGRSCLPSPPRGSSTGSVPPLTTITSTTRSFPATGWHSLVPCCCPKAPTRGTENFRHGGRSVAPPQLAHVVRHMQDIFPELNVTGWVVLHSPDGNLHEPVIDQHGKGRRHDTVRWSTAQVWSAVSSSSSGPDRHPTR